MNLITYNDEHIHSKSRGNAHLPVFRLSSDILLAVFFLIQSSEPDSWSSLWGWEVVVKICRRWRDVAIGCPGLWTSILTSNPLDKTNTFLERSEHAELNVQLNYIHRGADAEVLISLLKEHMWRVRSLSGVTCDLGRANVETLLNGLTDRCNVLRLRSRWGTLRGSAVDLDVQDINPKLQLKLLTLDTVSIPWSSSIYHGLTELELIDEFGLIRKPSVREFTNILEHCPNLQHLKLDGVWPTIADSTEIEESTSEFLHLKSIELDNIPFSVSSLIFEAFTVRDTAKLHASFVEYDFDDPLPLPKKILARRKHCKTLYLDISDEEINIHSNPIWNGTVISSETAISVRKTDLFTTSSIEIMRSVNVLLSDPSWSAAEDIIVSFDDFDPCSLRGCMDNLTWSVLLDSLSIHTRTLRIRIPFRTYKGSLIQGGNFLLEYFGREYTIFKGLPQAFTEVVDEAGVGVRLPELEQLTIIYQLLTEEDAREWHEIFVKTMEEHATRANRKCIVRFEGEVDFEGVAVPRSQ